MFCGRETAPNQQTSRQPWLFVSLEYFNDLRVAHNKFRSHDCPLVQAIVNLESPLSSSLEILRKLLGADKNTKILLCVDELKKALKDWSSTAQHTELLRTLTKHLDSDPTLFLSVSVYGFLDLSAFSTWSNRGLLLQALPPIFLTVPDLQVPLLPPVLQQFLDEKKRMKLAAKPRDLAVYARLSRLLVDAAGHPRRVNYVLNELSTFSGSLDPAAFSADLSTFLDTHDLTIRWNWDKDAGYPIDLTTFDRSDVLSAAAESLARDCARIFIFPNSPATSENHITMLRGTTEGYCSFLPTDGGDLGYAFVPLPVMRLFKSISESGPCTQALMMLCDGLDKFGDVSTEKGKDLEHVMTAALLLYSRSNDDFSLGSLCDPKQCGEGLDRRVKGGPGVALWKGVKSFPRSKPDEDNEFKSKLTAYVTNLQNDPSCPGAVFQPTDQYNMGGDFYGLFKCDSEGSEYVLMVGSCKDWFLDTIRSDKMQGKQEKKSLNTTWRESQSEFPGPQVLKRLWKRGLGSTTGDGVMKTWNALRQWSDTFQAFWQQHLVRVPLKEAGPCLESSTSTAYPLEFDRNRRVKTCLGCWDFNLQPHPEQMCQTR